MMEDTTSKIILPDEIRAEPEVQLEPQTPKPDEAIIRKILLKWTSKHDKSSARVKKEKRVMVQAVMYLTEQVEILKLQNEEMARILGSIEEQQSQQRIREAAGRLGLTVP